MQIIVQIFILLQGEKKSFSHKIIICDVLGIFLELLKSHRKHHYASQRIRRDYFSKKSI
jgi:hypothetical protein